MSTIIIDPGHGGAKVVGDPSKGTSSSPNNATGPEGTKEKSLTLDIALRVHAALAESGHKVFLTRETDVNLPLDARAAVARDNRAAVFISIHFNGDANPSVQGTETWLYENTNVTPPVKASPASEALARTVQKHLAAATGYRDRGVKRKGLGVLKPSFHDPSTAACLAEVSFLTNPADEERLGDGAYKERVAAALARAALEHLDSLDRGLLAETFDAAREGDGDCPAFQNSLDPAERPFRGVFTGRLRAGGGRVHLTLGETQVEVLSGQLPRDTAELEQRRVESVAYFRPYHETEVALRGDRSGDLISDARRVPPPRAPAVGFEEVAEAIRAHEEELGRIPGAILVRPGFHFEDGWVTDEPAIVVKVLPTARRPEAEPKKYGDVLVDVIPATPLEQLHAKATGALEAPVRILTELSLPVLYGEADEAAGFETPTINYQRPPHLELQEVTAPMRVVCHASPDAGWPTLKGFFGEVNDRLTVAMYDFTAPHVFEGLRAAMDRTGGNLGLIIDPKPSDRPGELKESEIVETLRTSLLERFKFAAADLKGDDKTFANSYHIKLAVRDGQSFWLSSGSWQNSNQPEVDPIAQPPDSDLHYKSNREWHVIVHHPELATLFEQYVEWDMQQAGGGVVGLEGEAEAMPDLLVPVELLAAPAGERLEPPEYYAPQTFEKTVRVLPLLTPDNYPGEVLKLINSAQKSIFFQNQYINPRADDGLFTALVDALRDKIRAGLDVRVILRDNGKESAHKMIEALKLYGFTAEDLNHFKLQTRCHNKGIIVDSEVPGAEAVLVGSHNWSGDGTQRNRDASLVFYDAEIVAYYKRLFDYDWERLAMRYVPEIAAPPVIAEQGAEAADGTVVVPWAVYFGS